MEQYICLYTSARQDNWDAWLPITTFVHNCRPNATTKCSPHEVLLGYCPSAAEGPTSITNNETIEVRHQLIKEHRATALQALNNIVQATPRSQHKVGDRVWLKAKHLSLPYASAKLDPKCHSPVKITWEIPPMAYQLELPRAWTIHDVFYSSLLMPNKETREHGAQFQCLPPKLIGNKEEYEVEQIINHRHHGKWCQLQYLICWKSYSAVDDTWQPADQVHTNDLVKYHQKHPQGEGRYKTMKKTWAKASILLTPLCHQPTPQTSLTPLPQASLSTWTSLSHSTPDPRSKHQWSTSRTASQFPWRLWQPLKNSVSCSSPPDPYALLSKDTAPLAKKSSSTSPKDWQELHKRMRR